MYNKDLLYIVCGYVVAFVIAIPVYIFSERFIIEHCSNLVYIGWMPALIADIVATVVIFIFGSIVRNSSVYDPYWSAIPPIIALNWLMSADEITIRSIVMLVLITLWSIQLTRTWALRWRGMKDEDWRYIYYRKKAGILYPLVDFFGIQLFPTLLVFAGTVPFYFVTRFNTELNGIDILAGLVMLTAISIEFMSDIQLRSFLKTRTNNDRFREGLWAKTRHPNYFGEMTMWWGTALFGMAIGNVVGWWIAIGAMAINLLFVFISVPLMDERGKEKNESYQQYINETNAVIPLTSFNRLWLVLPYGLILLLVTYNLYS